MFVCFIESKPLQDWVVNQFEFSSVSLPIIRSHAKKAVIKISKSMIAMTIRNKEDSPERIGILQLHVGQRAVVL